ncbi:MAG: hypothetical protein K2H72_03950 [Muribaculaceae bacterium]|nr:hypothetical protein [Muribaculaceae bacterium]
MIPYWKAYMGQTMLIGIACLMLLFSGCSGRQARSDVDSTPEFSLDSIQAEHDISIDARLWADSIISNMTLEEMAGQLIMPAVYADVSPAAMRLLREYAADGHIGGVVLLKGSVMAARSIVDTLRSMLHVPPFIAIDAEWGLAMRLEGTPEFPRNGRISADADETVMFDYGFELARECREIGINMVLGPVLDVLPAGKRRSGIGSRSFGRDAARAASLGVAYAKGLESGGVMSVAKHFPGHGSADADSHKTLPVVAKTRDELEATDLLPFRQYISNGMTALMTGHLFVPALDDEEEPVTVSEKILKDFVREELGFDGLIVTDAINMAGAGGCSAAEALIAGADIVLAPSNTESEIRNIVETVKIGRMPMDMLRDRVGRVLFFKYMMARDDNGSGNIGDIGEAERIIKLLR